MKTRRRLRHEGTQPPRHEVRKRPEGPGRASSPHAFQPSALASCLRAFVPACLIALLPLPACHTQTAVTSGRAYPRQVARGPTLDIQVFRRTRLIELTNTTARPFGQSALWLNGRFCHAIGGLAVGEHAVYRLADFTDEF